VAKFWSAFENAIDEIELTPEAVKEWRGQLFTARNTLSATRSKSAA
jgi:hypothetical protein